MATRGVRERACQRKNIVQTSFMNGPFNVSPYLQCIFQFLGIGCIQDKCNRREGNFEQKRSVRFGGNVHITSTLRAMPLTEDVLSVVKQQGSEKIKFLRTLHVPYHTAPCANKVGAGIYYAPFLCRDIVLGEGNSKRVRG